MEKKNHHEHELEDLNAASRKDKKKKLFLENYLSVLASRNYHVLTAPELNKILSINGFKQLDRKADIVEALSAIELNNLSRSTLDECITKPARMSLAEVKGDLAQLNWETSPVVSVRSINSSLGNKSGKKKERGGEIGRSGEQNSSVVPATSIDSTQYNYLASSTYDPKASVDLVGPGSKKQTGEQTPPVFPASSIDSTQSKNLVIRLTPAPAIKQKCCDICDQKEHGAVMAGTSSSSTTQAANKRKREVKIKEKSIALLVENFLK